MTRYEETAIIQTLADIIRDCKSDKQPSRGNGLYLRGTWLTPNECYIIAKVIEDHNDARYGKGNWIFDKEIVETLRKGSN